MPAAETASAETDSGATLLPGSSATVALAFRLSNASYSSASDVELVVRGDVDSPGIVVTLPGATLQ